MLLALVASTSLSKDEMRAELSLDKYSLTTTMSETQSVNGLLHLVHVEKVRVGVIKLATIKMPLVIRK